MYPLFIATYSEYFHFWDYNHYMTNLGGKNPSEEGKWNAEISVKISEYMYTPNLTFICKYLDYFPLLHLHRSPYHSGWPHPQELDPVPDYHPPVGEGVGQPP